MKVTGRRVRFAAVLVGVVLGLTGFSSHGGSSSSGKSKSGGGGGCSSSKSKSKPKTKKVSSGSSGSGTSTTASPTPTSTGPLARAEVVACAGPGRAKATVKVTSEAKAGHSFRVPLVFEGSAGRIESASVDIELKAGESRIVDLPMVSADKAGDVRSCVVGRIDLVSGSASSSKPGATPGSGSGSTGSSGELPDAKKTSTSNPKSTKKTR
ncbi:hypothetical protein J7E97_20650 [Streptomyces sp. ISL-66]|uniref:hypothetical protein n=1 Tax=Streptomyces sp. ISL-66 TaxID=2819186 RepID=UPI001BE5DEEC|nr:hypothetical protein [Streptomyces sp. ISL-66]MBT2470221.1 hypothetical protein [Streptomyces sp. ISL-66]